MQHILQTWLKYQDMRIPLGKNISLYSRRIMALMVFTVVIVVGTFVMTSCQSNPGQPSSTSGNHYGSGPPPDVWKFEKDQTTVRTSTEVFSIKYIDITPREFHFFFAFQSSLGKIPQITALSLLPSDAKKTTKLVTTIQLLGQLGLFTMGVIHIPLLESANQTIALAVKPTGSTIPALQLSPLQQLIKDPLPGSWYASDSDQSKFPEVWWSGIASRATVNEQVGYFKTVFPNQPLADRSYLFLRVDDAVTISVITKAHYLFAAGSVNFHP